MKKQIQGIFINEETGDEIFNPYIQVHSNERSYLKVTRSTLARIIYDLGGKNLSIKMLAVIINNIRTTDNHIKFGINRLIKYFSDYKEESIVKSYNKLKSMGFFKAISKSELIFNPGYLSFKSAENYEIVQNDYFNAAYVETISKGKKIEEIGDVKPILLFDNSIYNKNDMSDNTIFDFNYAKVKDVFISKLKELPFKKIKILSDILSAIKYNDKEIIICRIGIDADNETISMVVKYLCDKQILIRSIRGVYLINAKYFSASTPYKRKVQLERINRQLT